jgi:hypothetical protein
MRSSLVLLMTVLLAPSVSSADENFTGFWKSNCENPFGLQIMPTKDGQYSVSFCGPGGCFKPGAYRANTKIKDDPAYQVVDATHIKVQGSDGWSDYAKCTDETTPKLQYK